MAEVTCRVSIGAINDEDTLYPQPVILVESHHASHEWITLVIDGKRYLVGAVQLRNALTNATNW